MDGLEEKEFRAGYVAILGKPNVGKSTLLNAILQQKLSIVTPKPQTTRHKILGIANGENYQILFLDTPGLIQPKYKLHETMMTAARTAIDDADVVLLLLDVTDFSIEKIQEDISLQLVRDIQKPLVCVLNKVDAIEKNLVLDQIAFLAQHYSFKEYFPISALKCDGTLQLQTSLVQYLPFHPPYYPTDELSDKNERFFVSEIIREKIFQLCREEIPYSTTVDIIEYVEQQGKKDHIHAEIILERQSQKGIVIGKNGTMLKKIGTSARKEIEKFLERKVFLEIHVKVREGWRENEMWLKQFGYTH
jgi:GTP-binding protein Era